MSPGGTPSGEQGSTPLVSPSREAVRGASSTLCDRSRARRRSPQVSRREYLESLTLSPLLPDRRGGWKGFGAPGLKVFTFHCILAAGLGMWAQLAVSCRRRHDHGHSGWAILVGFIPIIGIVFFIYLGFIKGKDEPNQYGPSPY